MKLYTIIIISLLLSSCAVTKEQYGSYNSVETKSKIYAKEKEINLFWNMLPLQTVDIESSVVDYEIIKRRGFFDVLSFYGTVGIYSSYNVTVKVKSKDE